MMPKYRLVIFDSDGTLADTLQWVARAFNQVAAQHGIPLISEADHARMRNLSARHVLQHLKIPLWKIPALVVGVRKLMAEHIHEFHLFDGIAESLQQLHSHGVILGIVSSNSRENVRHILGPENAALIQHHTSGASIFGKAPKLRTVLKASRIPAREAIYLGDEIRDAEAARKAGMAFGAVAWGHHSLETLRDQNPEECFAEPREIGEKLV
jgi:phosphoglycolate phosphatase